MSFHLRLTQQLFWSWGCKWAPVYLTHHLKPFRNGLGQLYETVRKNKTWDSVLHVHVLLAVALYCIHFNNFESKACFCPPVRHSYNNVMSQESHARLGSRFLSSRSVVWDVLCAAQVLPTKFVISLSKVLRFVLLLCFNNVLIMKSQKCKNPIVNHLSTLLKNVFNHCLVSHLRPNNGVELPDWRFYTF